MLATALAAALLAATPAGPDLDAAPPAGLETVTLGGGVRAFEPGPFRAGELVGSGVGLLAGDALVLGLAYGTYQLFVSGALSPSVGNFRHAAYGLAAAGLLLPTSGRCVIGGRGVGGRLRPAPYWKAFLLSMVGHVAGR